VQSRGTWDIDKDDISISDDLLANKRNRHHCTLNVMGEEGLGWFGYEILRLDWLFLQLLGLVGEHVSL